MYWKQFMMCLEDTWFVAAFHSTPMHDPGLKEVQRPARVCVCKGASVLPCLLSCCCWRRRPPAVRRSRLRAAPPPDACPPESPWCRPVVAARRVCQLRRGAWLRACATRRGPAPGVPTRLAPSEGRSGTTGCLRAQIVYIWLIYLPSKKQRPLLMPCSKLPLRRWVRATYKSPMCDVHVPQTTHLALSWL